MKGLLDWMRKNDRVALRCGSLFGTIFLSNDVVRVSFGSVRKHGVDGSENVIRKSNFEFLQSVLNYYSCKMCFNYRGRKL